MLRHLCPITRELGFYTCVQNYVPTIFYVRVPDGFHTGNGTRQSGPNDAVKAAITTPKRGDCSKIPP